MKNFSERLKFLRLQSGISQKQIADDTKISLSLYQYYEYGQREPGIENFYKLCNYLQVSADYLLGLSDDMQNQNKVVNNNGAIVSNSNLRHSNINVNSNELTAYAKELIDIYKNLMYNSIMK